MIWTNWTFDISKNAQKIREWSCKRWGRGFLHENGWRSSGENEKLKKRRNMSCGWQKSGDRRWHLWKIISIIFWLKALKQMYKKPVTKPQQKKKMNLNKTVNTILDNENQLEPTTSFLKVMSSNSTPVTDSRGNWSKKKWMDKTSAFYACKFEKPSAIVRRGQCESCGHKVHL